MQKAAGDFDGLSPEAELHGYDLLQGKRDWAPLHPHVRGRIDMYGRAFQAIADHDVRIIIRGVDTPKLGERYRGSQPTRTPWCSPTSLNASTSTRSGWANWHP